MKSALYVTNVWKEGVKKIRELGDIKNKFCVPINRERALRRYIETVFANRSNYLLLEGDVREGAKIKAISIDQEHMHKGRDCAVVLQTAFLTPKLICHLGQ